MALELTILYRDDHLVAVDKPAGMLVHRSMLDPHERQFVLQILRDQIGQRVYPLHRLDRPTSGVLLFALSSEMARDMGAEQMHWRKVYLAVVRGYIHDAGELDYALKEQLDAIADKLCDPNKAAQSAVTRYWPLAKIEMPFAAGRYPTARYTLMALQPVTGRKHQLRRHMKHLKHPIVGDTTHGDGKQNVAFTQHLGIQRLLLHSKLLEFIHPITKQTIQISAKLNELEPLFRQLDWPVDEAWFQEALTPLV